MMDVVLATVLLPCLYYIWESIYYPIIGLIGIRLLQRIWGYTLLENRIFIIIYAIGIRLIFATYTKDYHYFYSLLLWFGTEILWSCSEYFTVFHAVAPADRILIIHTLLIVPYEWLSVLTSNYFPSLFTHGTEPFQSSTFLTSSSTVNFTWETVQTLIDTVYSTHITPATRIDEIILRINFILLGGLGTIILGSLPLFWYTSSSPLSSSLSTGTTESTDKEDRKPNPSTSTSIITTVVFVLLCGTVIIGIEYNYLRIYLNEEPFTFVVHRLIGVSSTHIALILYLGCTLVILVTVLGPLLTRSILNYPFTIIPSRLSSSLSSSGNKLQHYKILLVRKIFHFGAVIMFLPGVGLWTQNVTLLYFFSFTLVVAVKILGLIECIRILRIGPSLVWRSIDTYMRQYLDQRDEGIFILSHLYLLLGCALPVWLTVSLHHRQESSSSSSTLLLSPYLILLSLSGILSIGIGDAFAAIIGIVRQLTSPRPLYWGKIVRYTVETILGPDDEEVEEEIKENPSPTPSSRFPSESTFSVYPLIEKWSGAYKTVEGTLGFMVTYIITALLHLTIAYFMNVIVVSSTMILPLTVTILLVAITCAIIETCAGGSDNLVVPLVAWLLSYWSIYLIFQQSI